nr:MULTISPECIES: hypothetical protein [unclassified Coleofasciculus]
MTKLINLPGVIVENIQDAEETLIVSVRVQEKTAKCPRCGHTSRRLHQNKRHLLLGYL